MITFHQNDIYNFIEVRKQRNSITKTIRVINK